MKRTPGKPSTKSRKKKIKRIQITVENVSMSDSQLWNATYKARLAKMDALIKRDPKAALEEAYAALDYGGELVMRLIGSKALFYKSVTVDGDDYSSDEAVSCLCSRAAWLVKEVADLARCGHGKAIIHTWCEAKQLVEMVHTIAQSNPRRLRLLARDSLFLPSLRAKPKKFSHDFDSIAKAIGLSRDCIVNMDSEALHDLDSPATRLVAEILEEIASWQRIARHDEETLRGFKTLAEKYPGGEWEKYRNVTLEDFLQAHWRYRPDILASRALPPFNERTVEDWWHLAVKPYLEKKETLERIRGTPFYASLCKATETGKDYEVRDELKRRCKPKLKSLAKPMIVTSSESPTV